MSISPIVISQQNFTHRDNLYYPFEERGLQFGDGIYEVVRIYEGRYHLLTEHVDRLFRSAAGIRIDLSFTKETITQMLQDLLVKNEFTGDGKVYLQVTRGSAPRDHVFPENAEPNLYAYITDTQRNLSLLENGAGVITKQDERWKNCHIKSLNLLPNVMAKQEAKENNCYEAILHTDGTVTECSSANIYLVKNGKIYTHPTTNSILYGCVRMAVERFTEYLQIPFIEEAFSLDDIHEADEMFLTSSTSEVLPVVSVDGSPVNDGKPGNITRKLQTAYEQDAGIHSRLRELSV